MLAGCATTPDALVRPPELPQLTETRSALLDLPPPTRKLEVAVYKFEDVTGQFKTADTFQTLSKAVSQGGASVLVKALQDAGDRKWFTVVERTNLTNLLQERKIIRDLRQRYLGEKTVNAKALPPMLFAGIILEGGVVGYDSNTITGGAGARLLGIGGQAEYRHDTISVNLRAVSVKTGEVLSSVVVQKSIISAGVSASAFKYIDFDRVLELEGGVTTNEPGLIALTKAIEKAVYTLIMEGVSTGLWQFAPDSDGLALVNAYLLEQGRAPMVETVEKTVVAKKVAPATKAKVTKPKPAPAAPKKAVAKKAPAKVAPAPAPAASAKKQAKAVPPAPQQPAAVTKKPTPAQPSQAPAPRPASKEISSLPSPKAEQQTGPTAEANAPAPKADAPRPDARAIPAVTYQTPAHDFQRI
jgi:curli production assembly/transport component CsgG